MADAKHIVTLDKKISALSDALAHLGKGTELKELIRLIRNPGWTTPAELAFTVAILDSMQAQVAQLTKLSERLLAAGKKVAAQR